MRVRDGGVPRLEDVRILTVNVTRNFLVPRFSQSSYTEAVREDAPVGDSILQVNAQDDDSAVSILFFAWLTNHMGLYLSFCHQV